MGIIKKSEIEAQDFSFIFIRREIMVSDDKQVKEIYFLHLPFSSFITQFWLLVHLNKYKITVCNNCTEA